MSKILDNQLTLIILFYHTRASLSSTLIVVFWSSKVLSFLNLIMREIIQRDQIRNIQLAVIKIKSRSKAVPWAWNFRFWGESKYAKFSPDRHALSRIAYEVNVCDQDFIVLVRLTVYAVNPCKYLQSERHLCIDWTLSQVV